MQTQRTFSLENLAEFAKLSGDYNSLHTDPVVARRTHFGGCVVHGVFLLMWAIEFLQRQTDSRKPWVKVEGRFLRPVLVGQTVILTVQEHGKEHVILTVSCEGRNVMECNLTLANGEANVTVSGSVCLALPPREIPNRNVIRNPTAEYETLDLYWAAEAGSRLFPALAAARPAISLATLLATTRVIGMKIPGEHSIFLQLTLEFYTRTELKQAFAYRVAQFRKSSQHFVIAVEGAACRGTLVALARPTPVNQPSMAIVRQRVPPNRFAGCRVVVVGGSRGLGEVAAKLLAAGGAEVAVTYRLGKADAVAVAADISAQGGKSFAFQLDTTSEDWEECLTANCAGYNHICYFATPPILEGDGNSFSELIFEKFCRIYVLGVVRSAQWLAKQTAGRFAFFYASSIAVQTPPLRNLEYAAAKSASEACCRWLAVAHPNARIHVSRFPRLLTDQTASFLSAGDHDNLETVFAELSDWLGIAQR